MQDLIAQVHLVKEGGRRSGICSAYRCTLRFGDLYTEAAIYLLEKEEVSPGDTFDARIALPNPGYVERFLYPGCRFKVTEGVHEIGEGIILRLGWQEHDAE